MNDTIKQKLEALPAKPGVYKHLGADGKPLYVGKAKNLRSRVRSYFQDGRALDGRLESMLSKVVDLEVIVTANEAEALILENTLIKKLKPRYNINLRDDKSYPYVCIKNEPFPRVFPTRRLKKDGSKYYGPFTRAKELRLVLNTIRSLFRLRTCSLNLAPEPIAAGKYQTCLEYHIQKCNGPCVGYETREAYNDTIRQVEKLINGKTNELIALLQVEMQHQAESMHFEAAANLRDRIAAIERYSERQQMVFNDQQDRDVFAIAIDRVENVACGALFKIREGKVIGRQHKMLRRIEGRSDQALMQAFVEWYYAEATFFPEEVLLSIPCQEPAALQEFLNEKVEKQVPIRTPQRGDKAALVDLVRANAEQLLEEWRIEKQKESEERVPHAVKALQRDLMLTRLPRRIECLDISHLGGTSTVASCVVFESGKPRKSEYRTYKIRETEDGKPDDFRSMREVVSRRYARVTENNGPWPDLVVIDGGKGQLSSAVEALRSVEAYGKFPVVGLAKRLEEIFFPLDTDPVLIPKASASLQLIQRIRNEAHRFAITFQRKQRSRRTLHSELLEIPGVGDKTARKLLSAFGSVKKVREADAAALEAIVGRAAAGKVRSFYDAREA